MTLPTSLTDIAMGVFSGCSKLSDVYYSGTKAQWEQLHIDDVDYENMSLLNAVIHCSDGDIPSKGLIPAANSCGDNLTWSMDSDGTVTIQGMGDMWNYGYPVKTPPWSGDTVTVKKFVIKEGVTSVGTDVFGSDYYYDIISIALPQSITAIHESAFMGNSGVRDVYYAGTETQWKQIRIDNWNDSLFNATIHYNAGGSTSPAPVPSGISVTVGGKAVHWTDAEPFIDANDRTMVPLRAVADAMSLDVNWDNQAREASFTYGGKTIYFPIDSTTARTSDGSSVKMDTAAVIVSDRTYAPIRYLAEFFGYTVGWDAATKTVSIKK